MRICFISGALHCGGKERQFVELISGLVRKKLLAPENIMVITMHHDAFYNNVIKKIGVEVEVIERKFRKDLFLSFKLFKLIKKFSPDLVHSVTVMTSAYSVLIKFFLRFRLIDGSIRSVPSRNSIPLKIKFLNYLNYNFADLIISNTQSGLISFGSPRNKSFVIHNGFDLERISSIVSKYTVKSNLNIKKTDKIIGMVANFNINKDYRTFIRAAETLLQKRKDLTFLAVGEGPLLEKFEKSINPLYKDKIKFLGRQSPVEPIINLFDIAVLTTHGEGISNAILEYMALRKPVITTECAGTKEIIQNGITGLFVQPNSVEGLSDKIEYLLQNEKLRAKMGQLALSRIRTKFSSDKMVSSYFHLYKNLLS